VQGQEADDLIVTFPLGGDDFDLITDFLVEQRLAEGGVERDAPDRGVYLFRKDDLILRDLAGLDIFQFHPAAVGYDILRNT
jgi:hypothetical protein